MSHQHTKKKRDEARNEVARLKEELASLVLERDSDLAAGEAAVAVAKDWREAALAERKRAEKAEKERDEAKAAIVEACFALHSALRWAFDERAAGPMMLKRACVVVFEMMQLVHDRRGR